MTEPSRDYVTRSLKLAHEMLAGAFELRQRSDYEVFAEFSDRIVEDTIDSARGFVKALEEYLG